ncbi:hypothetical protein FM036_39055, partial [Nostoc sp. HG1]|nr:hypothetical protein [Nostoc sp. HG1]
LKNKPIAPIGFPHLLQTAERAIPTFWAMLPNKRLNFELDVFKTFYHVIESLLSKEKSLLPLPNDIFMCVLLTLNRLSNRGE